MTDLEYKKISGLRDNANMAQYNAGIADYNATHNADGTYIPPFNAERSQTALVNDPELLARYKTVTKELDNYISQLNASKDNATIAYLNEKIQTATYTKDKLKSQMITQGILDPVTGKIKLPSQGDIKSKINYDYLKGVKQGLVSGEGSNIANAQRATTLSRQQGGNVDPTEMMAAVDNTRRAAQSQYAQTSKAEEDLAYQKAYQDFGIKNTTAQTLAQEQGQDEINNMNLIVTKLNSATSEVARKLGVQDKIVQTEVTKFTNRMNQLISEKNIGAEQIANLQKQIDAEPASFVEQALYYGGGFLADILPTIGAVGGGLIGGAIGAAAGAPAAGAGAVPGAGIGATLGTGIGGALGTAGQSAIRGNLYNPYSKPVTQIPASVPINYVNYNPAQQIQNNAYGNTSMTPTEYANQINALSGYKKQ